MSGWVLSTQRYDEVQQALVGLGVLGFEEAPAQVVGTHRILSDAHAHAFIEQALAAAGPALLVEHILQAVADTRHNALALAMTASPTVSEALARACRYESFWVTTSDLALEVLPDRVRLQMQSQGPSAEGRSVAHACMLAALARQLRETAAVHVKIIGVELSWDPSVPVAALTSCFGVDPVFGADRDAVHLDLSSLEAPMRLAYAPFAAFFDASVEELVTRVEEATQSWQARASGVIAARLAGGAPSLEELARALGLSGRSLQRHLADEDTSHRQVLEETRRRLALSALDHRSNSVAEVAFALGYEHPGSFIRAFREWTGQTPGAWRKERWEGEAGPGTSPKSP